MRKLARTALAGLALGALVTSLTAPVMAAGPARSGANAAPRSDNRPGPFTERQEARRKAAMDLILSGKASPNKDGVVALDSDKYYEAAVTGTGHIFTILSEFGDQGSGKLGRTPGPLHNEIPKPNRATVDGQVYEDYNPALPTDNSTHWVADFNTAYYHDLFFGDAPSFKDFYESQSSGNFTAAGDVSPWVTVPGNASTYGDNSVEDFGGAWQFIEDSGNAWYDAMKTDGMSDADIKAYLAQFDVWDRNDYDNDGNFDEPDGYIDHFQAVHAGEGEDAGGGAQGADAIWSHRWYVNPNDFGATGPTVAGDEGPVDVLFGGAQIGDTGYWIGDYTVEAENGGLGVFSHEFAHDLGLPDFYDTNAGENGTAFWTLMSSGSWIGDGTEDIGTKPNYMGPWEKLQLGWLDYQVATAGDSTATLAPEEALIVDVADRPVVTDYTVPAGGHAWWTGNDSDMTSTLTRSVDLSAVKSATLKASAWYDIEAGYDYLYVDYSTDGGDNWATVGTPLDGSSKGHWKGISYSIPGGNADTLVRFRYVSDGGVNMGGAFIDDITIKSGGTTIFPTDTVENGENGWIADGGFKISTGSEEVVGDRYYIAENRTYTGYDAGLEVGPYQFSFAVTDPNKVEHFAFEDGLLVWMVDESYGDNNNSEHAGRGLALPVDARPAPFFWDDGTKPSNRRQPFDATFGTQAVPEGPTSDDEGGSLPCAGLHKQYLAGHGPSQSVAYYCAWPSAEERAAIATFSDSSETAYWDSTNAQNSVKTAGSGLSLEVTSQVTNGDIDLTITDAPSLP
ncbi:MAG TPA: immune inhibitor A domain-containing protein [Candidatus Limnocylindrales bacterium]|nr:immune inhibitor A domain-containing protein [Candidatus Limnocylindrales bacterium]